MSEFGGERQTTPAHVSDPAAGHERSDVELGPLVMVAIMLTVVTVLVLLATWGAMVAFERGERRADPQMPPIVDAPAAPVGPPLQPTMGYHPTLPYQDVKAMRETEAEILAGSGWVDRERGIVRIPITEAMKLMVQQQQQPAPQPHQQQQPAPQLPDSPPPATQEVQP